MIDYNELYDKILRLKPSLKSFIENVKNIAPMEKHEYSKLKYANNDYEKRRLFEISLPFAIYLAFKQSRIYNLDIEDAIGAAYLGLAVAIDDFNPFIFYFWGGKSVKYKKFYSFKLYLSKVISKYIKQERNEQYERYGIISDVLEIENQEYIKLDDFSKLLIDSVQSTHDISDSLYKKELTDVVNQQLDNLLPNEALTLRMKYGFVGSPQIFEQIGKELWVTRQRASQLHKKALEKLRKSENIKVLREIYYGEPHEIREEKTIDLINELVRGNGFIKIKESNQSYDSSELSILCADEPYSTINETLDIELYKNQIKRAKSKRTNKIKRTTRNNWRIRKQKIIWSLL